VVDRLPAWHLRLTTPGRRGAKSSSVSGGDLLRRTRSRLVRTPALRLALIAALAVCGRRKGAAADGDPAAPAEALFQQGKRLLQAGDVAAACPKLAESLRLDRATGTLLALARCHDLAGRSAMAWAEYREVIARAKNERRPDREEAARQWAGALEPRLSTLTIAVVPPVGDTPRLRIERDGVALEAPAWSTPVPLDPGTHVVTASAPGYKAWTATVLIGENGDHASVVVPRLARDQEAPGTGRTAPRRFTIAPVGGIAGEPASPAVAADVTMASASGWGLAVRGAWLAWRRQAQIDVEGGVTLRSYALRASGFRRIEAGRFTVTLGPELLVQLDRADVSGLRGAQPGWRSGWAFGAGGAVDVPLGPRLSISVIASADYAPPGFAGALQVTNRGEVLPPTGLRLLVGVGPRFGFL